MSVMQDALADFMESEALEKYFINNAEKPAVTIQCGVFTASDAKRGQHYTVWFNLIGHWNFSKLKDAQKKAEEILATTKKPITVTVKNRSDKVIRSLSFPQKRRRLVKPKKERKK